MNKKALLFGSISGVAVSVLFLGPWLFMDMETADFSSGEVVGYLTMLLCMSLVAVGIYSYRKREMDGQITFVPAMKLGLLITVISTVVFYLANVLLYEVLAPDFLSDFMEIYPRRMMEQNPNDPAVAEMINEISEMKDVYTNGWIYGLIMAGTTFLMGTVFSLLTSSVFAIADRKK